MGMVVMGDGDGDSCDVIGPLNYCFHRQPFATQSLISLLTDRRMK